MQVIVKTNSKPDLRRPFPEGKKSIQTTARYLSKECTRNMTFGRVTSPEESVGPAMLYHAGAEWTNLAPHYLVLPGTCTTNSVGPTWGGIPFFVYDTHRIH